MIVNAAVFTCSICGEPSTEICAYCTKDACSNHRCIRCKRCSDCCECEVPLSAEEVGVEEAPEQAGPAPEQEVAPAMDSSGNAGNSPEEPESEQATQDIAEGFPGEEERHEF